MSALCLDCGADTTPCTRKRGCRHKGKWEWYIVEDDVWEAAGMHPRDLIAAFLRVPRKPEYLCIGCLEQRLGRPLTADDFEPKPPYVQEGYWINDPDDWDTPRLAAARARVS